MATAEQIKALVRSHFENNDEQFSSVALQVAAQQARQGHETIAKQIRDAVQKARSSMPIVPVIQFKREISDLIICKNANNRLSELIVSDSIKNKLKKVLLEYRQQDKLKHHGLTNRRKILITGPPGTGKTLTASIIAGELHLPLMIVMMDKLVTKFMGETSARLRQVFDTIKEHQGVYLFDEFDSIGTDRGFDNDVGEMRRVLNSFLMFIEQDDSSSIIVAATNSSRILDKALFRRFDDVFHYDNPSDKGIGRLIHNRLGAAVLGGEATSKSLLQQAAGLSHAEIVQACDNALKESILSAQDSVSIDLLKSALAEKKQAYDITRSI